MATQASRRGRRRGAQRPLSAQALGSNATLRLTHLSLLAAISHSLSLFVEAKAPVRVFARRLCPPASTPHPDPTVAAALKSSCNGDHLITYDVLPARWRNNPFILTGYRFIPLNRPAALLRSVVTPHNEFLNIHTHLIPLLLWGFTLQPGTIDAAEAVFTTCILLCLGSSVVWHTMTGCADHGAMRFCARLDYVGIGWLISASIGTIVHYGYRDTGHPHLECLFLGLCLLMALGGSVLPFVAWFDRYENRLYRLAFFLALVLSAAAPVAGLAVLCGVRAAAGFVAPILPTLGSCALGLVFYALHIPERLLIHDHNESAVGASQEDEDKRRARWRRRLESVGAGSHSLWHIFIALGIAQWRAALPALRAGVVLGAVV
ncbi:hemolysin-III related-domain-containing protein [Mycena polygramma]|nr:hemolysin-III related-domain-containing protein [Mycena polygramma]